MTLGSVYPSRDIKFADFGAPGEKNTRTGRRGEKFHLEDGPRGWRLEISKLIKTTLPTGVLTDIVR